MKNYFYCYSKRMSYFIRSFGISYANRGINSNTKITYYKFEKSERLDKIIHLYNEVKHSI